MKKRYFVVISLLTVLVTAFSQPVQTKSFLQAGVGSGIHSFLYTPSDGMKRNCVSALFRMQYGYELTESMYISLGLSINHYRGEVYCDYKMTESNITMDGACFPGDLITQFNDWLEKQSLLSLGVPIEMFYIKEISPQMDLEVGAGVQLDLPLKMTYNAVSGSIDRFLYVPFTNVYYYELWNHSLGYYDADNQGRVNYNPFGLSLIVDVGVNVNIREDIPLYVGLYGSYGIAPIVGTNTAKPFVDFVYHGIMNSTTVQNPHTFQVGVKLAYRFVKKFPNQEKTSPLLIGQLGEDEEAKNEMDIIIEKALERRKQYQPSTDPDNTEEHDKLLLDIEEKAKRRVRVGED